MRIRDWWPSWSSRGSSLILNSTLSMTRTLMFSSCWLPWAIVRTSLPRSISSTRGNLLSLPSFLPPLLPPLLICPSYHFAQLFLLCSVQIVPIDIVQQAFLGNLAHDIFLHFLRVQFRDTQNRPQAMLVLDLPHSFSLSRWRRLSRWSTTSPRS